jgi:hypothetical protein
MEEKWGVASDVFESGAPSEVSADAPLELFGGRSPISQRRVRIQTARYRRRVR